MCVCAGVRELIYVCVSVSVSISVAVPAAVRLGLCVLCARACKCVSVFVANLSRKSEMEGGAD